MRALVKLSALGCSRKVFPIKNVKTVLKQTGTKEQARALVARYVVVYYVLGMAMMMTASWEVMRWLLEGSRTVSGLKSK
ncbi:MAG: transposase domain-containing protein [Cyanobacteriota/Melainabacteria group bacterium]